MKPSCSSHFMLFMVILLVVGLSIPSVWGQLSSMPTNAIKQPMSIIVYHQPGHLNSNPDISRLTTGSAPSLVKIKSPNPNYQRGGEVDARSDRGYLVFDGVTGGEIIEVWDTRTGQHVITYPTQVPTANGTQIKLTNDGRKLTVLTKDATGMVYFYWVDTPNGISHIPVSLPITSTPVQLFSSPDSKKVYLYSVVDSLLVGVDLTTGKFKQFAVPTFFDNLIPYDKGIMGVVAQPGATKAVFVDFSSFAPTAHEVLLGSAWTGDGSNMLLSMNGTGTKILFTAANGSEGGILNRLGVQCTFTAPGFIITQPVIFQSKGYFVQITLDPATGAASYTLATVNMNTCGVSHVMNLPAFYFHPSEKMNRISSNGKYFVSANAYGQVLITNLGLKGSSAALITPVNGHIAIQSR